MIKFITSEFRYKRVHIHPAFGIKYKGVFVLYELHCKDVTDNVIIAPVTFIISLN